MPLEMNPEIRAQWCAALRSGEYKQATAKLRRVVDGEVRHCCLGVLTDLAEKAGVEGVDWGRNLLQPAIAEWAGMPPRRDGGPVSNPYLCSPDGIAPAAELNDTGWTFAEIADLIDGGEAA